MSTRWKCRAAARTEASRLQAQRQGFVGKNRIWTPSEIEILTRHHNEPKLLAELLPSRSPNAIEHMRAKLGFTKPYRFWTAKDLAKVRRFYQESTASEVLQLFPGRSLKSIQHQAYKMGLTKPKAPFKETGIALLDDIRSKCHSIGYSMNDLDQVARTGKYFKHRRWKHTRTASDWMIRAAVALGGDIRVDWIDE